MRNYYKSGYAQEFDVEATLRIEDDGRFVYNETWSSYGAAIGGRARGVWWQYGGVLFFRCDEQDGVLSFEWTAGETKEAIEGERTIAFGNFTMELDEPVPPVKPPLKEDAPAPVAAPPKDPLPLVARLHFKDGRILEKPHSHNPPPALFTQVYFRLVDENGENAGLFQSRPNSPEPGSQFVDYDEI